MARGRAPKDPSQLARRNKVDRPFNRIEVEPVPQPPLPDDIEIGEDSMGLPVYRTWPPMTVRWWERWGRSPMAANFTEDDWDELLISAIIHADYVRTGNNTLAAELRMRTAKFGATPEDRARLRVQYVQADDAERRSENTRRRDEQEKVAEAHDAPKSARDRFGPLRAV